MKTLRQQIATILHLPLKRVHYHTITDEIKIDLDRNRHVQITTQMLDEIKTLTEHEEIIVSTPYRCVIVLKLVKDKEMIKWIDNICTCCCK